MANQTSRRSRPPSAGRRLGQNPPGSELSVKERFEALRNVWPLLQMVWAVSPAMTLWTMLLRLLRAGLPVAMLYIGKLIIDDVVALATSGGSVTWAQTSSIWLWVGIELGLALVSDGIGRVIALLDSLLGDLFTNETSTRLMAHAARLDLKHFEDAEFYDKLERARRQTTGRIVLVGEIFTQVQDFVTIAFLGIGLIVYAPWLILLLVLALVPAFLGEAHFNSLGYSLMFQWTPERRELDYLRYTGASDETAKEVKIFGLSAFLTNRYRVLADRYYHANRKLATRRALWGIVLAAVGSLGYYAAYVIIIWRTVNGVFSVGDLTFLAGSFRQLRRLLEGMLLRFTSVAERALFLKDLFEFFELAPEIDSRPEALPMPETFKEGFRFEQVSFRYPGTEAWVLRDVSFTLKAGEVLALVGENGAGKTTLVKLLARLYDPDEGRILLDGRDLRDYNLNQLRESIGVIFQNFVRYQLTASDNIATGRIEARTDRPRIETAAERSLADTVIEKLPDQFDQMIGRRFAGGVELSGGEWQKNGAGTGLYAGCATAHSGRTYRCSRCPRRVSGVRTIHRTDARQKRQS